MSKLLYEFLKDWLQWAEGNHINQSKYVEDWGLCSNSGLFLKVSHHDDNYLAKEMKRLFAAEGLDKEYPFMTREEYFCEEEHHKHPVRLAWVHSHIKQYEQEH